MERLKVKEVTVVLTEQETELFKGVLNVEAAYRGLDEVLDGVKSHRYTTCRRMLSRFDEITREIKFDVGDKHALLTLTTLFILAAKNSKGDYLREKLLLGLAQTFQDTHRELGV